MDPTIAFVTARRNSRFTEWFLPSLARQVLPGENPVVIKIDRFADEPHTFQHGPITVHVHPPKPSVWSGPHRLTREDWWSTSSYRNTSLCLADAPYIAYADDLSIPSPEWWAAAKAATNYPGTITCGLYAKVQDMVVEDGLLTSYTPTATGVDRRIPHTRDKPHGACPASWMFGCSLVAPVATLLSVGGWPEMADGLSFEDCLMSTVLGNNGVPFRFDRRLFTHEDELAHHEEKPPMIRRDKGVSPNDKSHAALALARTTVYWRNTPLTAEVRAAVQSGQPFPIPTEPTTDWFDGQPIAEMDSANMP